MKYAHSHRSRHLWPVCLQCDVMRVSFTGYRQCHYEVKALDLEALVAAGLVLLFTSAIATFVPAMRATQVGPVETLRGVNACLRHHTGALLDRR